MDESVYRQAKDLNGAVAGEFEPDPNLGSLEAIASKTGIDVPPEVPLNVHQTLKNRDDNRLEPPLNRQSES